MNMIDALRLFLQVIWMMVGTPIIGVLMAFVLSVLLVEQVAGRRRMEAIHNH